MNVTIRPADSPEFEKYGQVIKVPVSEPTADTDNFKYWKQQALLSVDGPVEIGVLNVRKHEIRLSQMERHDHTPEILVGLDGAFIVTVAASSTEKPVAGDVEAFRVEKGQAVYFNTNCWHWAPCPVDDANITILVIFKDNTSQTDLIIEDLDEECIVVD
jgi:ureidoglycolate hydrolase